MLSAEDVVLPIDEINTDLFETASLMYAHGEQVSNPAGDCAARSCVRLPAVPAASRRRITATATNSPPVDAPPQRQRGLLTGIEEQIEVATATTAVAHRERR